MNLPFHKFNQTLFIDALGHVSAAENVMFSNRNVYCVHGLFLLLYSFHLLSYIYVFFLIQSQNAPEFLE